MESEISHVKKDVKHTEPAGVESLVLDYDAFIRSIKRNKDTTHAFLLGAGASISSGIQSATDCIWEWKRDIFTTKNPTLAGLYNNIKTDSVRDSIQNWIDSEGNYPKRSSHEEYTFYANKAYPIPDDRRKYFQSLCEKKEPYIGYRLLMLLAECGIVKSVWSTNFDGLVVKAAYQANLTPIEIALDSVDRIYRNDSKNELLSVALHGDYKYGELKNTEQELDNQNDVFSQTLIRYLQDKNLIILGYSGRDASLMRSLKQAFSTKGSGRLYWCGYGDQIPESVLDLLTTARGSGREAYFISTDGFDKTMLHLSKSCFESSPDFQKKIADILSQAATDEFNITPFTLNSGKPSKYLKSNLHPVILPKEVFQFEINYKDGEKPWKTIKEICEKYEIAAVPFKNKVFAISTKSLINEAFKERLKSEIIRVTINKFDVKKVGAFKDLMLNSILSGIAATRGLLTDKRFKIWLPASDSVSTINDIAVNIHKALRVSLYIDEKYVYLTFKPDLHLASTQELGKEIRQPLTKGYFEKLYNNKYDKELEFWTQQIFQGNAQLKFEYPVNSGNALFHTLVKDSAYSTVVVQNQNYTVAEPVNYNPRQGVFKGVQYLEPELTFLSKNLQSKVHDFHPMRGLTGHSPYDHALNGKIFSMDVNLGVICPVNYSQNFYSFLNEINQSFVAGVNPDYLIDFPGFLSAFKIPINIPLPNSSKWLDVSVDHTAGGIKDIAIELARRITTNIDRLAATNKHLIATIFIPNEWEAYRSFEDEGEKFDLHDYIKAYAAQKGISTQLIEENTLTDNLKCQIFWWLSLSFYVKSLRTPWVLSNLDKTTAFAGIGYSISHGGSGPNIVVGCSHIYNSEGQGLKYKLAKVEDFVLDKQSNPFMSYDDAFQFGLSICELFYSAMGDLPARVVVHKKTPFTAKEIAGIKDSLTNAGIKKIDLIEISFEPDVRFLSTKLYNNQLQIEGFPLSRGTCILIEPTVALLWTHGIVPSVRNPQYKYYLGGRSIPAPLKVKKHYGDSNLNVIASEILGLTKMNWNSFDLYTKFPATIESSNEIARIGKLLSRFEGKTYDYRLFI